MCLGSLTFKYLNKNGTTGMSDRLLVLVRHGQSEWNLKNLFTGWKDPDLTEKGIAEAKDAGQKLRAQGLSFDIAFTSVLKRAQHTLDLALVDGQGVLILSRFTGASHELPDALLVNPYDTEQLADSIHRALEMVPEER